MATDWNLVPTRWLTISAIAFAAGFGVHGLDHLRRRMAASPTAVMIGGTVQGCSSWWQFFWCYAAIVELPNSPSS